MALDPSEDCDAVVSLDVPSEKNRFIDTLFPGNGTVLKISKQENAVDCQKLLLLLCLTNSFYIFILILI